MGCFSYFQREKKVLFKIVMWGGGGLRPIEAIDPAIPVFGGAKSVFGRVVFERLDPFIDYRTETGDLGVHKKRPKADLKSVGLLAPEMRSHEIQCLKSKMGCNT